MRPRYAEAFCVGCALAIGTAALIGLWRLSPALTMVTILIILMAVKRRSR